MSYKSRFSVVPVGSVCTNNGYTFKKISNAETKGRPLPKCEPNCISLHNGHKCVIGDNMIVTVLEKEDFDNEL